MRRTAIPAMLLTWACGPGQAYAQAPMTFSLDPVFVSRFVAEDEASDAYARALRLKLEGYLASSWLVVPLADVKPFEDYSAATYLDACRPEQNVECAFVIGERAQAEWAIAAKVFGTQERGVHGVEIAYVDVAGSQIVLTFTATVSDDNEAVFLQGVTEILDRIVQGAAQNKDVRGEFDDPRVKWEQQRRSAELAAASLRELEGELGVMVRSSDFGGLDRPRLKAEDLAQYDDRDDDAPWVRLDMDREEYLRFKNSGKDLVTWRSLSSGRLGRLFVRIGGGFGQGPFHQVFDGRSARAVVGGQFEMIEVDVFQQSTGGGTAQGELEVGIGVHRLVDVGAFVLTRTGSYSYLIYQETVGDPEPEGTPVSKPNPTLQFGGRATFAPYPTSSFRPTGSAGLSVWTGSAVTSFIGPPAEMADLPPPGPPTFVFLELAPGVEATLSKQILVYARGSALLRVAGDGLQQIHTGEEVLQNRGRPAEGTGGSLGFTFSAGIVVRLQPFGEGKKKPAPSEDEEPWDDEPDF